MAFSKICELLQRGHQEEEWHSPEHTLNRLFRKHVSAHQLDLVADLPNLSGSNVTITTEQWLTADLKRLAPGPRAQPPRVTSEPVAIVRYRDRNCLIDGGKRIHHWHMSGDAGPHSAYILTVATEATDQQD